VSSLPVTTRPPGSAMQELDAASMFDDLPDRLLGATEGNDIHS
jgi:hypothetical protein